MLGSAAPSGSRSCASTWRPLRTGLIGTSATPATAFADGRTRPSRRARQRAVDHVDCIHQAIDGDEGAKARALLLAEQHLVEHVEPVERHAGTAILALFVVVEERLAAADLVDH